MKKNFPIILAFVAVAFFISTAFTLGPASETYSPQTGKTYKVSGFSKISISVPADVYIEQSTDYSLKIDADPDVLNKIEVEVKDGTLHIEKEKNLNNRKGDIKIYISSKKYNGISLAGSCDLEAKANISSDELSINMAGSCDAMFSDLKAEKLKLNLAGSCDIDIKGEGASLMKANIAGSADLSMFDFPVEKSSISIAGSGDCEVYVTEMLDASVAGSGSIVYKGTPKVKTSVHGSGSVSSL